ncbi:MAG: glycerol dehydrogenase [Acetobacteraceae bacterium]|nr:glycerol dehydrogenase [Acetobacteraceae bacterium]
MISTSLFPSRYVQGEGALSLLLAEVARLGKQALAIVDPVVRPQVAGAFAQASEVAVTIENFRGECCDAEIERQATAARACGAAVIIGIGGGKALDTAKSVGHALGKPVVIVPSLASTDAPCSALAVIYTQEGAFDRYLVLPRNPDVVLVDTNLIAAAPVRFLVSGMGDALSTWFEAEDCRTSGAANMTGRLGSMTAFALARLCYDTLLAHGAEAMQDCADHKVTDALEKIVEANTLLSGLGFESGGLSGAHAVHNGLTALAPTHRFWHGEKVAFGTQTLLMLTGRPAGVVAEVYGFCESVGLPTTLADIGLNAPSDADLLKVAELACAPGETIFNVPVQVTPQAVVAAMKAADSYGHGRKPTRHAA